ncbi:Fanconi anemia group J protein isoform X2 [Solenopsis invicta]|nr:Fanconi anemia group J protein isoform X2 [Solenopsis invicta]XP_039310016.1 Fanconi anemia group J protein isoform X2 [Solenopsis invicta]
MKKGRLSLNRKLWNETAGTCNDPVEISSDDDSIDVVPNILKSTRECTSVTNHEAARDLINIDSKHNVSVDSSDEDVTVVDDTPYTFNKSPSLFNWSTNNKHWSDMKTSFNDIDASHQNNFPGSSVSPEEMPLSKKQKLMNEWRSHSSYSESTSTNDWSSKADSYESIDNLYPVNETKDDPPLQVEIQHNIMIAGIPVKFPVKPYPCQIAVANSLIEGCKKEQNCLLESPTGSGKTLALLCSSLAWQEYYSEKLCQEKNDKPIDVDGTSSCIDESLDSLSHNNLFLNNEFHDKTNFNKDMAQKVPKIYYGTRTHKQIAQVVKELKRTAYKHKRMTILSSRDHTCIQQTNRNKNDLCNELLDPHKNKTCPYYNEHSKKKASIFGSMPTPWDIEDLVSLGNSIGACPYFGARSLMTKADIIFCPYNYILDPAIRESMQIRLRGDIVILDEAHNIEDICREAANVILRDDEINTAIMDCHHLSAVYRDKYHDPNTAAVYDTIEKYFEDFVKFIQKIDVEQNKNDFKEMTSKCWPGSEFQVLLDIHNVGCPKFSDFHNASDIAIDDFITNMKEERHNKIKPTITRDTKNILEHLCLAIEMITSDIYANDYRIYVVETIEASKIKPVTKNSWLSKNTEKTKIRTLKVICMNPAVTFAPLARDTRSVILASGTLTPTTSFQSELGTKFPRIVNPNHIIPKDQIYIRCIPRAPNGQSFKVVYEEVNKWTFQDNLGNLVIQVCDAVPYGVLCFFSSYHVMNTICNRWKENKMWDKLSTLKTIFMEPKDHRENHQVMEEYRSVIEKSSTQSFRDSCGALLFAVFRGKMAEGIDFSDNEARCVLAIGIPYFRQSNDITMKMNYNDANISKGLLSGREWYTVNAFRALNQAIGRCVRHINDWGAVLLIDERHMQSKNNDYLPKWIKQNMKSNNTNLDIELQDFVAIQAARESERKSVKKEN